MLQQADANLQLCFFGRASIDLAASVVTPDRLKLNCSMAQLDV